MKNYNSNKKIVKIMEKLFHIPQHFADFWLKSDFLPFCNKRELL